MKNKVVEERERKKEVKEKSNGPNFRPCFTSLPQLSISSLPLAGGDGGEGS